MEFHIKLAPKKLLVVFGTLSCLLTFVHVVTGVLRRVFNHPLLNTTWIFDVGGDNTVPTWYSSLTLLICSLLLLFIGSVKLKEQDRHKNKWLLLALIFLFLSIDEVATIHETFGKLVHVSDSTGFFQYEWVIFGLLFVLIVGLYCFRFILSLPSQIKILFLLSGLIYVAGALGLEMINARTVYLYGKDSRTILYAVGTTFEELCEMLGISLFIYSLLKYIKYQLGIRFLHIILIK